ncbi:MAG: methylase N-4/N-6 protein, partial [Microgenomates group bacterium GW2011_GWA2_46_16]
MKLTDLKPADYNPRTITDEQMERLKKSLAEFGDLSGIVFNRRTGNLVGGHQRLKCLPPDAKIEKKDLKAKTKTGTIAQGFIIFDGGEKHTYREVDWDEATEKTANIAANKHGGEWDDDKLGELLKELSEMPGFDLDDLYILGKHRLLCGDATKKDDVERLMDGKKADMVFTDPPYNYKEIKGGGIFKKEVLKVAQKIKDISSFDPANFLLILPYLFHKKSMNCFIFCNKDLVHDYLCWAVKNGYSYNILTWHKAHHLPLSSKHHYPDTEYLLYFRRDSIFNSGLSSDHYRKYFIMDNEKSEDHPTIKPIKIIETEIKVASKQRGIVTDLFLGSGSTLIACEKTNRICYGMEIDPHYCDVIV